MPVAFFLTLALQAASGDMPIATQAAPPPPAPKPAAAAPPPSLLAANPAAPPSDDYGYVSWCYGALGTYVSLYDQVMPEISRIEHAFPGPEGVEEAMKVYPQLRAQAQADLKLYASALRAAEQASAGPINAYGQTSMKRGRLVWGGINAVTPAKLAQLWMSWSPPEKCEVTAKALKARSAVLGQALAAPPAAEPGLMAAEDLPEPPDLTAPPAPAAPTPVADAAPKPKATKLVTPKPTAPPPAAVAAAPPPAPAATPAPEPRPAMMAVAATTPSLPAPDAPMASAAPEAMAGAKPAEAPPPVAPPPKPAFVPEPTPASYDPSVDPAMWYRGVP